MDFYNFKQREQKVHHFEQTIHAPTSQKHLVTGCFNKRYSPESER